MRRKEFLKSFGLIVSSIALSPVEVLAHEGRIVLGGYVHKIVGDTLSDSFHNNADHGLWVPIYNKVKDFYSKELEVEVILNKESEVNKEWLNRSNISVEYTTLDNILKSPREVLYSFGGKELIDELEVEIKRAQKEKNLDYKTAEAEILTTIREGVRREIGSEGGVGSKIAHRAWVFPSKTFDVVNNNEELVNAYAHSICHEVGHALSLEHPKGKGIYFEYGQINFMNPIHTLKNVFSFNFDIHPNQVRQINDYLKGSRD